MASKLRGKAVLGQGKEEESEANKGRQLESMGPREVTKIRRKPKNLKKTTQLVGMLMMVK